MVIDWEAVKDEASTYLSELIRINTSLKNEMDAIKWIQKVAKKNGLYTWIQETAEGRGNIILSLKELNTVSQPIVLLSHLDVVPANKEDWEYPPFSGLIVNNVLWGRGTIDTKQLTITHLMTLLLLKRYGILTKGEVVMVATSDEETGSNYGIIPLLKEREDLFKESLVFNEGGGFPIVVNQKPYYLCEMGQKGLARIKITSTSQSSSNPYLPNNSSLLSITEVIDRIHSIDLNEKVPTVTHRLFERIANENGIEFNPDSLKSFLKFIPIHLQDLFNAMTKTTFSITKWYGGKKHPQLKGNTEIYIDCRPIPTVNKSTLEMYIQKITNNLPVEFEILEFSQGYETPINQDVLDLLEKTLHNEVTEGIPVPFLSIGSSDARHLISSRSQVYGYCPMLPDMTFDKVIKMVHGINERIPLDSLNFGIQNLYKIILALKGSGRIEIK